MASTPAHDMVFDKVMDLVGNDGPFQRRFNFIFNIGLIFIASMVYMNIILALNVPEHNCYVPGREFTNFTNEEWKNMTIPWEQNNKGHRFYSSCKMYNNSLNFNGTQQYEKWNFSHENIIDCVHGYEYDKTWYEDTLVSQEDWVCEKNLYQTNIFVFGRIGEVIGTFVFGQLGDTLGRRIIYYFSLFLLLGGRIILLVLSSHYTYFSIAIIFGSFSAISIFQSPLIIAMEVSKAEDRASIAMYQSLGWTTGVCTLPLIFWMVPHWIYLILITTLPLILFLLCSSYMIESPRWLASRGRLEMAAIQLNTIARINGKDVELDAKILSNMLPTIKCEKVYGMASLFTGWRLAKNTFLLVMCWIIVSLGYFTLIIHISQLGGNPFLNFFFQSIIEAPAYVLGQYAGNRIGRRWTNVASFVIATVACIGTIFIVSNVEWEAYLTLFAVIIKFWTTVIFFTINLQAMETYPTCLRLTGLSVANIVANALAVIGPYIVYLGINYNAKYPYIILGFLYLIGTICSLFLPETLHQKLPDTLEEAKQFGADQSFWSLPKAPRNDKVNLNNEEIEKLNQEKYSL